MTPPRRRATDMEDASNHMLIEAAAERAVKRTFAIFGVDVDDPAKVEEFRKSLRFSDALRKAAERGILVFVSAVVSAIAYAMWVGIKDRLGG